MENQFIDSKGRTQILGLGEIRILIQPTVPFSLEFKKLELKECDYSLVEKAEKDGLLIITHQSIKNNLMIGVWCKIKNKNGFIPIIPTRKSLILLEKEAPTLAKLKPSHSQLEDFSYNYKVANLLKHYICYDYVSFPSKKERIIVKEGFIYDLNKIGNKLSTTSIIYENNLLIVPSEKVKKDLLLFLEAQLTNNLPFVLSYSERDYISDFNFVSDFKRYPNQRIFIGKESLLEWIKGKDPYKQAYKVYFSLQNLKTFYYHGKPFDELVRIYNTSTKEDAIKVSYWWNKIHKISFQEIKEKIEWVEFTLHSSQPLGDVNILNNKGKYAGVLLLRSIDYPI